MTVPSDQAPPRPEAPAPVAADVPTAPAAVVPADAPRSTHRPGNWRSLIISMLVMTAIVFAIVALIPRPAQRERPALDAVGKAAQIRSEQHWAVATLDPGPDWRSTVVSFSPDAKGVMTWTVGYHRRPGDDRYVSLTQTRPEPSGSGATEAAAQWLARQTKSGRDDGRVEAGGRAWRRVATSGDAPYRCLVADGANAPGGLTTVLCGESSYDDLARLAATLRTGTT